MIKKLNHPKIIERYERYVSIENRKYELRWKNKVLQYYTCGSQSKLVECLDFMQESVIIREILESEKLGASLTLKEYNNINKNEPLDLNCNCHGFSFTNGKFFINNHFVDTILKDEFLEVCDDNEIAKGNFDIICFKDDHNEWVHSCKHQYELLIQKEGIRNFSIHRNIEEIQNIDEYQNTIPHFFRRKERSCPGICLNAIGEEHVKTFANNA